MEWTDETLKEVDDELMQEDIESGTSSANNSRASTPVLKHPGVEDLVDGQHRNSILILKPMEDTSTAPEDGDSSSSEEDDEEEEELNMPMEQDVDPIGDYLTGLNKLEQVSPTYSCIN